MCSCVYGWERSALKLWQARCVSEPTLSLCTSYQWSPWWSGSFITADMSSSHFGARSSYVRVLSATDAHVLLGLTLLQFYLWYLETHFVCEHKRTRAGTQLKHRILWFTRPSSTRLLEALAAAGSCRGSATTFPQLPSLLTSAIQNFHLTCASLATHCRALARSAAWGKAFMSMAYSCRKEWHSFTRPSSLDKFYANTTFHGLLQSRCISILFCGQ